MKTAFLDSEVCQNMHLGRTKMEALVKNVLAPFALEQILNTVRPAHKHLPFSIATDASNKGAIKLFPIAIRFFDVENDEEPIVDALIDFRSQWGEKSDEVVELLLAAIKSTDLDLNFLTAFSADNAPVNFGTGEENVYRKMKNKLPKLIKANCNCHILHNTAKYAMLTMKYDVQELLLKVYSEFSHSTTNNKNLREYFDEIEIAYAQMIRCVPQRCAGLYLSLEQLLKVWEPVKRYFVDKGEDCCSHTIWKFVGD